MYFWLLFFHVVGAAIWVGGHLILATRILPKALRLRDPSLVLSFEKSYESIGLPALLTQVLTGILLAYHHGVKANLWFRFSHPVELLISLKLSFLILTLALAVYARFFLIPGLSAQSLPALAVHIGLVTLLGLGFVFLGLSVR
jgi:putative copper export protein